MLSNLSLAEEKLVQELDGVLRAGNGVADGARVAEDLVIVTTLVRLVTEEVDLVKALVLNVAERVGLVPT
jgi:hypothetical protein